MSRLRSRHRSWPGLHALIALLLAAGCGCATAQDATALKAAIVFNLLEFVQWPDEAQWPPGTALTLCADRAGPLWPSLNALQTRAQRGPRPLQLREQPTTADGVRACHAWLAETQPTARRLPAGALTGLPLLVIADIDRAGEAGVTIGLLKSGDRLAFEVDLVAARRSGLQISSRLLRLAEKVHQ